MQWLSQQGGFVPDANAQDDPVIIAPESDESEAQSDDEFEITHFTVGDYRVLGDLAKRRPELERFGRIFRDLAKSGVGGGSGAWVPPAGGAAERRRERSDRSPRRTQAKSLKIRPNRSSGGQSARPNRQEN